MKNLKSIFVILLATIIPFSFSACSKNKPKETEIKKFVGVAIYQNLNNQLNWSKFIEKPNAINNIISTENDKIVVDENPELLFYVYTQNEITSQTIDSDYISNTTRNDILIKDNQITFHIERIFEDTDVLIYYIYKLENATYFLEYQTTKTNINAESESFDIDITHDLFSTVELKLETNLSIKKEY